MFGGAPKGAPNFEVGILLPPNARSALNLNPEPATMRQPPECDDAYTTKPNNRDNCVKSLMAMIDVEYNTFKDGLLKLVDNSDLAADLAVMGLGSATALVGGTTTKAILGAISAGIVGAKNTINADILYNTSIFIIVNQMDTDRATQRCIITTELKLSPLASPPTYSMYDASADLIQYYQAGTFTHALQALGAKTGSQVLASKAQATNAQTSPATVAGVAPIPATPTSTTPACSS